MPISKMKEKLKMPKFKFNPDGSLKLPERIIKKRETDDRIFKEEPSIRIIRKEISPVTPLKCALTIEASTKLANPEKIKSIFYSATGKFRHMAKLRIRELYKGKYIVTIISGQFRCSWCENFIEYLEKEMNAKIINWGSCLAYTKSGRY